ncbi:SLOG domain-containing protein [Clostridium sp.]
MKVFIVAPSMTMKENENVLTFNEELKKQLDEYGVEYNAVTRRNMERMQLQVVPGSLIIVYNNCLPADGKNEKVEKFIKLAIDVNAEICPVALDKDKRIPTGLISKYQSYDVQEQLRCRSLSEQYIRTIAKIFSRKIIGKAFPTSYSETGEIFLSHRRLDGEDIAARIYDKMIVQEKNAVPFRDVVNVQVGESAQTVIDEAMKSSDVFVFIHTPEANNSEWIQKELRFAMLRNIPILWIQIDGADTETLKMKPSEKPHMRCTSDELDDDHRLTQMVDEIFHKSFEMIMERSNQALESVRQLERLLAENVEVYDQQKMIYHISAKRKGYHYPQRKIEQYYQIFGRTPTEKDICNLKKEIKSKDIDSIAILTNRVVSSSIKQNVVIDRIQDFYYNWKNYIRENDMKEDIGEIIISGAFSDADELFQQSLTDALVLFAKVILRSGHKLTFGAHPTFQELFYEVAAEVDPIHFKNELNMYISNFFLDGDKEKEKEYREKYTLFVTDKKDNRNSSLTEMRKRMIQRNNVKALVCLGGKVKENKKEEGVREEIALAREYNIPVFVVGSVGGCSSVVASEYKSTSWHDLNGASEEVNDKFFGGIDYFDMAEEMIRYLKREGC